MWHYPSPWPGTTKLCSGKDGEDILVDRGRMGEVRSKKDKRSLFSNMTPVLPLSGPVGDHPGASSVSGGHCRDRIPEQTSPKWQDRGIIPV